MLPNAQNRELHPGANLMQKSAFYFPSNFDKLHLFVWSQTCLISCCRMMHWCSKEKINRISFHSIDNMNKFMFNAVLPCSVACAILMLMHSRVEGERLPAGVKLNCCCWCETHICAAHCTLLVWNSQALPPSEHTLPGTGSTSAAWHSSARVWSHFAKPAWLSDPDFLRNKKKIGVVVQSKLGTHSSTLGRSTLAHTLVECAHVEPEWCCSVTGVMPSPLQDL